VNSRPDPIEERHTIASPMRPQRANSRRGARGNTGWSKRGLRRRVRLAPGTGEQVELAIGRLGSVVRHRRAAAKTLVRVQHAKTALTVALDRFMFPNERS